MDVNGMEVNGAQLFVRYAYPPNSRGSCGPPDSDALLQYGQSGVTDAGFRELAKGFAGAWPYLELIAGATGNPDPLDYGVVEAYWVGNALLDSVGVRSIGNSMEDRFRARTGHQFPHLMEGVIAGGVPHHSFHVLEIYPWLGLLRDDRRSSTALHRPGPVPHPMGEVVALEGDNALVRSRPLVWDGIALSLGEPVVETAKYAVAGTGFIADLTAETWCPSIGTGLRPVDARPAPPAPALLCRHLKIANSGVEHRGAAIALEQRIPNSEPGSELPQWYLQERRLRDGVGGVRAPAHELKSRHCTVGTILVHALQGEAHVDQDPRTALQRAIVEEPNVDLPLHAGHVHEGQLPVIAVDHFDDPARDSQAHPRFLLSLLLRTRARVCARRASADDRRDVTRVRTASTAAGTARDTSSDSSMPSSVRPAMQPTR